MNRRIKEHNREIRRTAESRAKEMRTWPSPLEEKMIAFLDSHDIRYKCQKVIYITADDGWIEKYYIADFFIEEHNVIIEVDGRFHDSHRQADRDRTKAIEKVCPGVKVLRYRWNDFKDTSKMAGLLHEIM